MDIDLIVEENAFEGEEEPIKKLVSQARDKAYFGVNTELLKLYWNIGKRIIELQNGDERALCGKVLLEKLSQKLRDEFGIGFSKENLEKMRRFYVCFPIRTIVSSKLSWSHYAELVKISERKERIFYLKEAVSLKWTAEELRSQMESKLYERVILAEDQTKLLESIRKGRNLETNRNLVKDEFLLEFLELEEKTEEEEEKGEEEKNSTERKQSIAE